MKDLVRFVMVGEVDHGKSTLIGRLLYGAGSIAKDRLDQLKNGRGAFEFAHFLDNFKEERDQARTIDTTQVRFKYKKKDYLIIDVPGHFEFIKNMITGSTQAEAGVLIVDITEGIKEQSKRHLHLLSLLGIKDLVIAVNKMDSLDYNESIFVKLKEELSLLVSKFNLNIIAVVPISALNGDNIIKKSKNMSWYQGSSLIEALNRFDLKKEDSGKGFIMPVQGLYTKDNREILMGQVVSGSIKQGDKVRVLPLNRDVTVKAILKSFDSVKRASKYESIGLILEDSLKVKRGAVIVRGSSDVSSSNNLKAIIFSLSKGSIDESLDLVLRCSTQEVSCKIIKIRDIDIQDDFKILEVEIELEREILLADFDLVKELGRFILLNDDRIIAGGVVKI